MNRLPAPTAPTNADRWAWERFYTDTVEYLMVARAGERARRPSEVAEEAKRRTIDGFKKVTRANDAPSWLTRLGEPPDGY